MTADQIIAELQPLGRESYRKVLLKHGIAEPCFGVKISELKKIQRRVRKDHALALGLYASGIYDAQYLATLIADETRMTARDFRAWLNRAKSEPLSGAVARVAAESPLGWDLALKWIDAKPAAVADAGWSTLASIVGLRPDDTLDLPQLEQLLARIARTIHSEPDRVRYSMNSFVIAVGGCVRPLSALALQTAEAIGPVAVDMGDTACEVPFAPDCIRKIEARGGIGKKRRSARC